MGKISHNKSINFAPSAPDARTSHRVIVFCQFTGLLSQLSKRLQLKICELMLALKQQAADCDHKIRGAIAGR